jgi:hypothetical protein
VKFRGLTGNNADAAEFRVGPVENRVSGNRFQVGSAGWDQSRFLGWMLSGREAIHSMHTIALNISNVKSRTITQLRASSLTDAIVVVDS